MSPELVEPSYVPPSVATSFNEAMGWASGHYRLVWSLVVVVALVVVYGKSLWKAITPSKGPADLTRDKTNYERMKEARFKQQMETERALQVAAEEQRRKEEEKKAHNPVTEKVEKKKKKPSAASYGLGGPPPEGGRTFQPLTGAGTRPFRPSGFRRQRRGG